MTVSFHLQIDSRRLQESLGNLRRQRLPHFRQQLTVRVLEQIVQRVVARHPVETGRARDAWLSALSQIRSGTGGNSQDARSDRSDDANQTRVEVTNEVDYVVYLENGTRDMRPRHMVRQALAEAHTIVAQSSLELFRELVP